MSWPHRDIRSKATTMNLQTWMQIGSPTIEPNMKHLRFQLAIWSCYAFVACSGLVVAADSAPINKQPSEPEVERIGPPTAYMQDIQRCASYQASPPEQDYPIPQTTVNRQTYFKWLEDSGHFRYVDNADKHGMYGPRHLMPVLAKFVQSGDRKYGEACIAMLKAYHEWLRSEVARIGWHEQFMFEPGYIGLYRRYLMKAGLLDPERDQWFKELVLYMNRTVHVWNSTPTLWRGPMHRAQGEGTMKELASRWYPDIPEAAEWQRYAGLVYQDWWRYRDFPPNDIGYLPGILFPLFLHAELVGDDSFFTDADARKVWDRLMLEVSPDGSIVSYGAGAWNCNTGPRIMMLEMVAAKTHDGRYRFVAQKLMNYLLYQQQRYLEHGYLAGLESTEPIAAAYLLADDSIAPVEPDAGSTILYRKETLRLRDHRNHAMATRFLGQEAQIDPNPERAQICCGLLVTEKTKPSKLVLRSGWNGGDLFALVDLFPRHDPLNVPGILGITRHGAALTASISAKDESDENRLIIRDLSGKAPRRLNQDPGLGDKYYQEVEIPQFVDLEKATFATVKVSNYMGFPISCTRELVFLKNRFIVVRDLATFEEGFKAEVASVFNTQNVGPQVGRHWANTFMNAPTTAGKALLNPPVDLLVYFTPQAGHRMQVVDRTATDPRCLDVPNQLSYAWQGTARGGQTLHFTEVLYPHAPRVVRPKVVDKDNPKNKGFLGESDADAIEVLADSPAASVLRCKFDPDRVEWIVCNPSGSRLEVGELNTDARAAYLDVVHGKPIAISVADATFVTLDGADLVPQDRRKNVEK